MAACRIDRRWFSLMWLPWMAGWLWGAGARGADPECKPPNRPERAPATMGGKQFWADEWFFHAWHIQRNVLTGHYRLLDGADRRHAWGSFEACRRRFARLRADRRLPPMRGPGVVVLHGLFRTRTSMAGLCRFLRTAGGYTVFNVGYPSTRGTVGDHARSLDRVLRSLEGIDQVLFVAHSMGNLVVRHYLADAHARQGGNRPDVRFRRMVMLGPPNHGSELARKLVPWDLSGQLTGPAARQLGRGWSALAPRLATPRFEFGILAGGGPRRRGRNPLISGDDDLIVSVTSTQLAGARDFRVLPVWHMTMMNDPVVQEYTLRFLQHGYFESAAKRRPLAEGPR